MLSERASFWAAAGVAILAFAANAVCTVIQNEHEDDVQDEHVEPGISGARQAVRAHRGGALLTVARRASPAVRSWSW
jgi:hypothetical protein